MVYFFAVTDEREDFMTDNASLILYEDNEIIVVRKPAGLPVQHKGFAVQDLESILKNHTGNAYLAVIHRLDQPVEGLLVFAKSKKAAAALNADMQAGKIKKEYMALTECGTEKYTPSGVLTDYLVKDGRTNTSRVAQKGAAGAKEARLSYTLLPETSDYKKGFALLQVVLDTGRHHQIRVQLAHAGMPILGDRKYGVSAKEEDVYSGPLCLCAYRLTFIHPTSRKKMRFEAVPEFLSDPEVRKKITKNDGNSTPAVVDGKGD